MLYLPKIQKKNGNNYNTLIRNDASSKKNKNFSWSFILIITYLSRVITLSFAHI